MKVSNIKRIVSAAPSLVVAFYIIIPTLNQLFVHINPSTEGLMAKLYLIGGGLSVLIATLNKRPKINNSVLLILCSMFLLYFTAIDHGAENELTIPFFLMFAILPFVLPQFVKIDARVLAIASMILPSFGVLYLKELLVFSSEGLMEMDLTYSLLAPIISTVVYLNMYWKDDTWKFKLFILPFIIANVVYFFYVALFGSRAPTMSVVLCILFLYVFQVRSDRYGIQINQRRLWIIIILLIIVIISFISIVNALDNFLGIYGVDSGTLEKLAKLSSDGDLSNGRSSLTQAVWTAIWKSPLFGYGMSSSHRVIFAPYPHNFILQFLLEGGVLLALIIIMPMFRFLSRWYKRCNYNDFSLVTLLLFSSVIGALFSMDVWMNPRLWLFFGVLFSNNMSYNNYYLIKKNNYGKGNGSNVHI